MRFNDKLLKIIVAVMTAGIVVAPITAYEIGLSHGFDKGYGQGFRNGVESTIVNVGAQYDLSPNGTVYFSTPLMSNGSFVVPKSVNLSYALSVIQPPNNESWGSIRLTVTVLNSNAIVYQSAYSHDITGYILIDNTTISGINIFVQANPANSGNITIQWTSPMVYHLTG